MRRAEPDRTATGRSRPHDGQGSLGKGQSPTPTASLTVLPAGAPRRAPRVTCCSPRPGVRAWPRRAQGPWRMTQWPHLTSVLKLLLWTRAHFQDGNTEAREHTEDEGWGIEPKSLSSDPGFPPPAFGQV